jgi:hypothetical protein
MKAFCSNDNQAIGFWKVGSAKVPYALATLYADARHRVLLSRRLRCHYGKIMECEKIATEEYLVFLLRSPVQKIIKSFGPRMG